ncbi:MAG: caspase family protein [Actinomycetota bacterium]|nr:caspase family protein [Actinomycetota bacterium]
MTGRLPDPASSRAVIIGVSRYTDPELPGLPGVDANLDDLRAVLTSARGTGLPERNCVVIRDPLVAGEVGEPLARAAREAEDTLLVYYAGHGLPWTNRAELYLAMSGTRTETVGTSALRCGDVRQAFIDSRAKNRILILDCCFAGRAIERTMSSAAEALVNEVDVAGAYILAATASVTIAPEGDRNTLFTAHLLGALRDGIPGAGDLLTVDTLYRHLTLVMTRSNGPLPRSAGEGAAGHLALARNHADEVAMLRAERDRLVAEVTGLDDAANALDELRRTVDDKIVGSHRPVTIAAITRAGVLLTAVDATADVGEWDGVMAGLAAADTEIAEARAEIARHHAALQGLLDRRAELRGLLSVYQAMAVRTGVVEGGEVAGAHGRARDLLWTRPCDLSEAESAVLAYQALVTR